MIGLNFSELSIPTEKLVSFSFLLLLLVYVVFSAVLFYHWNTYAMDKKTALLTMAVYFSITVPLLMLMGGIMVTI